MTPPYSVPSSQWFAFYRRLFGSSRRGISNALKVFSLSLVAGRRVKFAQFPRPGVGEPRKLFILGSGSSIDTISQEHWREIAHSRSVGINYWVLHPFLPDYIFCENSDRGQNAKSPLELVVGLPSLNSRPGLLYSGRYPRGTLDFLRLSCTQRETVLLPRMTLLTKSQEELRRDLDFFFGLLKPLRLRSIALDAGTSVSRVVTAALMAGWSEIVLVGFDLDANYFREIESYFKAVGVSLLSPSTSTTRKAGKDYVHPTNNMNRGALRTEDFIVLVDEIARMRNLGKILNGGRAENFNKRLEKYDWGQQAPELRGDHGA